MKTKHAIYLVLTIFLAFLFMNGEPMIVKAQQSDQEMNPKLSTEKNASLELKSMIEQELYHQRKDQPTPKIASLKIQNNRIVDQKGKPFVLKGISTHGIAWFPEIINQNSFTRFRDDFGLNTVRIAMYTAEDGGYCTGGDQQNLESRIDQGVQLCQQLNLYCIIDWHILSDQDPLQYKDQSKLFFEKMA
ncbi:cellulase family glycosylhydrolase, partial [Dubosiella newyorkensis]